jgi:hypothetical protein
MRQSQRLRPPSLNLHSLTLMQLLESIKLGVDLSSTLRLVTQATTKATPRWFELGLRLGEPPNLKVHLEGHVTFPHFRDVNILVEVFPWWCPSTLLSTCPFWISYFRIDKAHSFTLCFCVLNIGGFTICVFCFHPMRSLGVFSKCPSFDHLFFFFGVYFEF